MKTKLLRGACTAAFLSFLFISCEKNPITKLLEEKEATVLSAETDVAAEAAFDDVFNTVMGVSDEVGMAGTGAFGRTDSSRCFSLSISNTDPNRNFPKKVEIDFGSGCVGTDGTVRTGKITTIYTNRLTANGASATTTFEDFSVNGVAIDGSHVIKQSGNRDSLVFHLEIKNARIIHPDGHTANWESEKELSQIEGNGTRYQSMDDAFSISGTSSGTVTLSGNDYEWSKRIIEPLIKANSCRYFSAGTVGITRNGKENTINFGDGTCDDKAVVTINGVSITISLR